MVSHPHQFNVTGRIVFVDTLDGYKCKIPPNIDEIEALNYSVIAMYIGAQGTKRLEIVLEILSQYCSIATESETDSISGIFL
jgi:hypothetical protein